MDMDKFKQGIKPGLWGAVIGAAALAIIGFNWGGWVTGSAATELTRAAVLERLVPICVGQFNADADKAAKLAALKKADSWKQGEYVAKQGWATMPGAKEANSRVADSCADAISS
jgi:alpha/beta superfamily hydrolase